MTTVTCSQSNGNSSSLTSQLLRCFPCDKNVLLFVCRRKNCSVHQVVPTDPGLATNAALIAKVRHTVVTLHWLLCTNTCSTAAVCSETYSLYL